MDKAEYYKIGNIVYVDGLIKGTNGKSHLLLKNIWLQNLIKLIFSRI